MVSCVLLVCGGREEHFVTKPVGPVLENGRKLLLQVNLKSVKLAENVQLDEIAKFTEGYSGADITNVCR